MTEKLYRVIRRRTRYPGDALVDLFDEVLYCGPDRFEARCVFHQSEPSDSGGSYGNPAIETHMELIEDAGTDDPTDDIAEAIPAPRTE